MSVEADFAISEWVYQGPGHPVTWELAWPGVIEDGRFVAVSFQSDYGLTQLVRVSESFTTTGDSDENHIQETIRATSGIGGGVAFRFSVVVVPSH